MSAIDFAMFTEFQVLLRVAMPSLELPENFVDMMCRAKDEMKKDRDNVSSTPVRPKYDLIMKSDFTDTVKSLPFAPDRLDYGIEDGRCDQIEFDGGLFLPCCAKCGEGMTSCKKHLEKPTVYGNYAQRCVGWDGGMGIGSLCYEIDIEKEGVVSKQTKNEITYGEFLMKKQITLDAVKKAIKDSGFMFRINPLDLIVRGKPKKVRGRPSDKKVKSVDDEASDSEEVEIVKPKVSRTKLTEDEKAQKAVNLADRKAAAEQAKTEKALITARAKEDKAEKAVAEKATKPKPKPERAVRSPKSSPPPIQGTSLDAPLYAPLDAPSTDFDGDLSTLTEFSVENNGEEVTYWHDDDRNVFDASKKKIGVIGEEGDLELL